MNVNIKNDAKYIYMSKIQLLNHLKNGVYCRIGVSKVSGVGVIAIKDIPKNVNPFRTPTSECVNNKVIEIPKTELKNIDDGVKKLLDDFYDSGKTYPVSVNGLNNMDISFYLNHSKTPNMKVIYLDNCNYNIFVSTRLIKSGEELFFDYDEFNNQSNTEFIGGNSYLINY